MKAIFIKFCVLWVVVLSTTCLFAYGIEDEKAFWKDYQKILDIVLEKNEFRGRYGTFFHNSVNYDFFNSTAADNKEIKSNLSILIKNQIAKLINLTEVPDPTSKIEKQGLKSVTTKERKETLAFWINVYNFYTLEQVQRKLKIIPIDSMKDIGWKKKEVKVGETILTLDEVEHKKIRQLKDARIHFVVNCASVSCPTLDKTIFLSTSVDKRLDELVVNAFRNPLHLRIESGFLGESLETTKLFRWYKEDWGSSDGVLTFLKKYMPKDYYRFDDYSTGIDYDWNLNTKKYIEENIAELKKEGYSF